MLGHVLSLDKDCNNRRKGIRSMPSRLRSKLVTVLPKGQVTIPCEFRGVLGINSGTLNSVSLVGDHLDTARFLEEDKLKEETARRVRESMERESL